MSSTLAQPRATFRSVWLTFVLVAVAILFPPGINLSQYWLHNPLYGYGLWVPALAAYLFWDRLGSVSIGRPDWAWIAGVVFICYGLALLPLRILQVASPDWRMLDWLLGGGAVATFLALLYRIGGAPLLKVEWFPVALLLTAIPWSTASEHAFTESAIPATASLASEILWLFHLPAAVSGRMLHTTVGPIGISEDCSGIRSLHVALMASLFWAGHLRLPGWRTLIMVVLALGTALLLNLLRVVTIVGAAVLSGNPETADRWHDPAGVVALILLLGALPLIAKALSRGMAANPPKAQTSPKTAAAIPLAVAVLALVWCGLVELGAEGWFRLHERGAGENPARWTVSHSAGIAGATEQPIPSDIRENYRFSDSLALAWNDPNGAAWRLIWLDFNRGVLSACTHNMHRPDWCLPAHDYSLAREFPNLVVPLAGTSVAFRHQLYQQRGRPMHLFFVVAQDLGALGQQAEAYWTIEVRLRVARLGIRSQHSQMVHLLLDSPASPDQAREAAVSYLQKLLVAGTPAR